MNKLLTLVMAVMAVSMGWAQSALAEQDDSKGVPVEFFACNWQKGKDLGDLDKVAKKFVDWSEQNDSGYSAWILTPQFHDGLDFDVAWMGSWPDSNAFGKSQDAWNAGGREIAADFDAVVDCSAGHQMATSVPVSAPDGPPGDGVVIFSACTLQEGKTPLEGLAAHKKVGAAMKGMGSKASSWLFYPGMGSGDHDFHYWSVIAFNNYAELGAASELYINGGGWEKAMVLLGPVTSCVSPTTFDAKLVRSGASR